MSTSLELLGLLSLGISAIFQIIIKPKHMANATITVYEKHIVRTGTDYLNTKMLYM